MSRRALTSLPVGGGRPPLQLARLDGGLFSTSSISAADPRTGALSANAGEQFQAAFDNLQRLLDMAGISPAELGLVTVNIPDQSYRPHINKPWLALFPDEQRRPARKTNQYPLPAGQQVQLQAMGLAGQRPKPLQIPCFAHKDPLPAGVRIGDLVFSSVIVDQDPATGKQSGDPEVQLRQAFTTLETLVKDAGGSWDDVLHMYVFLRDRAEQPLLIKTWLEVFPADGNRPARKTIFYDELKGRTTIAQLQAVAVIGQGQRKNYEIPNVGHHDPIPMGASIGRLMWSSGMSGQPPGQLDSRGSLGEQCRWAFTHLRSLTEQAGASPDNVGHVTLLVRNYDEEPEIMRHWRELFPHPDDEPTHHTMALGLSGQSSSVQVHIVGAL